MYDIYLPSGTFVRIVFETRFRLAAYCSSERVDYAS